MDVVVVGSLNLDTTVQVPRLPAPGETILGTDHFSDTGGKGANQAVAVARLGGTVAMVGLVGDDDAGRRLRAVLAAEGVDPALVAATGDSGTGIAIITVDASGENTIVVDPGANGLLSPEMVSEAGVIGEAAVVLAQLEVPIAAVAAAAHVARGTFVLNPAPAAALPEELLAATDILVPNASEAAQLTGFEVPDSPDAALEVAAALKGPKAVVVTLGALGAVFVAGDVRGHVAAPEIHAVDPTAAGDAFCGGLALALAGGAGLAQAVEWGVRCGAVTATRRGARSALPTREEVEALEG